jgi:hypothetical protein
MVIASLSNWRVVAQIDAQLLYVSRKRVKEASAGPDLSSDLVSTIETLLSFVAEEFADV